ncbi:MAG TPA: serine hydrolase domain-containing protein [Arthrobacter sp.]|nr:serine hydrolase domain-containing protein [Arthrobacter sp.]
MDTEPVLEAALLTRLGSRHPRFAAAAIAGGKTTLAFSGAGQDSDFEIGSISKGITGLLYADACRRGDISPATPLGELLPLGNCGAASVSLGSLSRHASGLPRLPPGIPGSASPLRRTVFLFLRGQNPYGETLAELLEQARAVRLQAPRPRYSNLGFELLGHAIAAGAGMSFRELVTARLCGPLALGSVYMPATPGELRPAALAGTSRRGRPREPWTGEALAPAGGIRASIQDLARLAQALLDGSAPGRSALDPVADFAGPAARIGAAWLTLDTRGRRITWHSGGTGGFSSWMGLDREANAAVVLLSATAAPVDRQGFELLRELAAR